VKDISYEELEREFDKYSKHRTKIILEDLNAKVDREDILNWHLGMKMYRNYY
jgi:hypothetical protein